MDLALRSWLCGGELLALPAAAVAGEPSAVLDAFAVTESARALSSYSSYNKLYSLGCTSFDCTTGFESVVLPGILWHIEAFFCTSWCT